MRVSLDRKILGRQTSRATEPPVARRGIEIILLAVAYFVAARLGQMAAIAPGNITPVWIPSGLILAAVLIRGRWIWPGIFWGALAGNAWAYFDAASFGAVLRCLFAAAANGAGDSLGAVVGAHLLLRLCRGRDPFDRPADVVRFVVFGAVLGGAVSALCGVTALCVAGIMPWANYLVSLTTWWTGDSVGVLILTPMLLAWRAGGPGCRIEHELLLFILLVPVATLGAWEFFPDVPGVMVLPLLMWAVFRFDSRVSFTAISAVASLAVVMTAIDRGPFSHWDMNTRLISLQLFLALVTLPIFVLHGALKENKRTYDQLRDLNRELDQRVRERTQRLEQELVVREQAETALRGSESRFRGLFQNMLEGYAYCRMIFEGDRPVDFVYVDVNRAFGELTGLQGVIGKKASEVIPGIREKDPLLLEAYGRVALTGTPECFEHRVETLNMWFAVSVYRPEERHFVVMFDVITQRRQMEQSLRESEERFRSFFELSVDLVCIADLKGSFLTVNGSFERVLGYSREELLSRPFLEFIHPDDRAATRAVVDDKLSRGETVLSYENRYLHKQGGIVWLEWSLQPLVPKRCIFAIARDITERKRAEAAMRRQLELQDQFGKIAATVPGMIYSFRLSPADGSASLPFSTPVIEQLWGFRSEELCDDFSPALARIHPDDLGRVQRTIDESGRTMAPWRDTFRVRHPQRGELWIEGNAVPKREPDGSVLWHGFAQDVTDRKRAEEEIRQLNVRLEQRVSERTAELEAANASLVRQNTLRDGINVVLKTALVSESEADLARECLRAAEHLTDSAFGFVDELNAAGTMDAIALSDPGWAACRMPESDAVRLLKNVPVRGIYAGTITKGESMIANDPASHPDQVGLPQGHPPLTAFLGTPLKQAGKVIGMIGLGNKSSGYSSEDQHDMESLAAAFVEALMRKRAEARISELIVDLGHRSQELEAANKELEAFAYSVSHDLRSPLRGIDGWSHALVEDYGDKLDDRAREYLGMVCSEAQRMGELIDDLLALSRVTRSELTRMTVDLSALARSILVRLRAVAPGRSVEVVIAPDLTAVGDPTLLRQVLENLLGNAWKFTAKQPLPVVELGRHGTGSTFFVRDNGAGFDMAHAAKMFAPFQRLHRPSEFPGSGIGLATVQRILHRHGGRVWAEGEVDKGATFYFTLPGE